MPAYNPSENGQISNSDKELKDQEITMISVLYVDEFRSPLDITCRFLERTGDLVVEVSLANDDAVQKMNYRLFDAIVAD
jgi:CheY-like chemotaxis protein